MSATVKMHTPHELRRFASMPDHIIIPITSDKGPMLADALEIADESCVELIKCNTTKEMSDGGVLEWWDLTSWEGDTEPLDQAVRYLEARGLLERHPRAALQWVRPKTTGT